MLGPDAGCLAASGKAFLSRGEFLLSSGLPPTRGTAFPALGGSIGLAARIHCWESSPSFRSFWLWKQTGIKSSFPKNASKEARGFCLPLLVFRGVFLPAFAAGIVPLFGPAELSQGYFLPSEVPAGISWKPEMLLGAEKLLALAQTARAEHHPSEMLPLGCSQPHPCRGEGSWAAPLELLLQPNTSPIQINLGRKRTWADFHPGKEINPRMLTAISPCPARSKAALCQARTCG